MFKKVLQVIKYLFPSEEERRNRYFSQSTSLSDLEYRMKQWDKKQSYSLLHWQYHDFKF